MDFKLSTPCNQCPFVVEHHFDLKRERKQEIAKALLDGKPFACHKTVLWQTDPNGDDDAFDEAVAQHCAGALVMLEKLDDPSLPGQWAQVAGRLGIYDRSRLDMKAGVYPSFEAWIQDSTEV